MKYLNLCLAGIIAATPIKAESDNPFMAFSDPPEFGNRMIRQADSTGKAIKDIIYFNGKIDTIDYGNPNKKVDMAAIQPYDENTFEDISKIKCLDMKMSNTPSPLKEEMLKLHFQIFQYFIDGDIKNYAKATYHNAVYSSKENTDYFLEGRFQKEMNYKKERLHGKKIDDVLGKSIVCSVDKTDSSHGSKYKKGDIIVATEFKRGVDLPDLYSNIYRKINDKWKIIFTD